jgi:cytochrome c biogenesis protein CcmG/thiol:disulfide interchange protein DsbE
LLNVFVSSVLGLVLMQDPAASDQSPKQIVDQVRALMPKRGASREEAQAAQQAVAEAAKKALKEHATVFATGEGLHWRGVLQSQTQQHDAALESFLAHAKAEPNGALTPQSLLTAASITSGLKGDAAGALALLEKIDLASVGQLERQVTQLKDRITVDLKRNELNGKAAPAITASHVLNGDAQFSLDAYKGKVVLLDFWATWCPPCRAVIPDLVKLQAEMGAKGVQVLGVTKFYKSGMDFSDPSMAKPHGGKPVKELDEAAELAVNENFIKAFEVNYPIVFANDDVGAKDYLVRGIPTVFVIGRDGKVVGHVVGGGEANHKKLHDMVHNALGVASEASHEKHEKSAK